MIANATTTQQSSNVADLRKYGSPYSFNIKQNSLLAAIKGPEINSPFKPGKVI